MSFYVPPPSPPLADTMRDELLQDINKGIQDCWAIREDPTSPDVEKFRAMNAFNDLNRLLNIVNDMHAHSQSREQLVTGKDLFSENVRGFGPHPMYANPLGDEHKKLRKHAEDLERDLRTIESAAEEFFNATNLDHPVRVTRYRPEYLPDEYGQIIVKVPYETTTQINRRAFNRVLEQTKALLRDTRRDVQELWPSELGSFRRGNRRVGKFRVGRGKGSDVFEVKSRS